MYKIFMLHNSTIDYIPTGYYINGQKIIKLLILKLFGKIWIFYNGSFVDSFTIYTIQLIQWVNSI